MRTIKYMGDTEMTKNDLQTIMQQYQSLTDWAKTNGHDVKHVRRLARTGDLPSAFKIGNGKQWYMPKNANDVIPEPKPRGTSRDDGRLRYTVYANADELALIADLVGSDNVIDPRVVSREKRAAKKLSEMQLTDDVAYVEHLLDGTDEIESEIT